MGSKYTFQGSGSLFPLLHIVQNHLGLLMSPFFDSNTRNILTNQLFFSSIKFDCSSCFIWLSQKLTVSYYLCHHVLYTVEVREVDFVNPDTMWCRYAAWKINLFFPLIFPDVMFHAKEASWRSSPFSYLKKMLVRNVLVSLGPTLFSLSATQKPQKPWSRSNRRRRHKIWLQSLMFENRKSQQISQLSLLWIALHCIALVYIGALVSSQKVNDKR